MLKAIRRFLLTLLLIAGALFLLFQAFLYYRSLDKYPTGTAVAGISARDVQLRQTAVKVNSQSRTNHRLPISLKLAGGVPGEGGNRLRLGTNSWVC